MRSRFLGVVFLFIGFWGSSFIAGGQNDDRSRLTSFLAAETSFLRTHSKLLSDYWDAKVCAGMVQLGSRQKNPIGLQDVEFVIVSAAPDKYGKQNPRNILIACGLDFYFNKSDEVSARAVFEVIDRAYSSAKAGEIDNFYLMHLEFGMGSRVPADATKLSCVVFKLAKGAHIAQQSDVYARGFLARLDALGMRPKANACE